jgi:hypothetical protein
MAGEKIARSSVLQIPATFGVDEDLDPPVRVF